MVVGRCGRRVRRRDGELGWREREGERARESESDGGRGLKVGKKDEAGGAREEQGREYRCGTERDEGASAAAVPTPRAIVATSGVGVGVGVVVVAVLVAG